MWFSVWHVGSGHRHNPCLQITIKLELGGLFSQFLSSGKCSTFNVPQAAEVKNALKHLIAELDINQLGVFTSSIEHHNKK